MIDEKNLVTFMFTVIDSRSRTASKPGSPKR